MTYLITYLVDSEYCELKPSDPKCHITANIVANSKAEAIRELHDMFDLNFGQSAINRLPVVWCVEVI